MSRLMLALSLLLNVLVLLPVTWGLFRDLPWAEAAYGASSPGRSILLAIYLAILVTSAALLSVDAPRVALGLLIAQIVYKLLTPITVGTLAHPVVLSNLGIAAFHSVTAVLLLRRADSG